MTALFHLRGRWLAALLGLLLPLAFAPFHLYLLALALPALLFLTWQEQPPREAACRAFLFGFAAFGAGTYWLYISIRGFGGAPIPVAVLLMFAGFLLMGLYLSLAGWLAASAAPRSAALRWCFAWPAAFTLVEWLRGWLFFGFPWFSIGYGQIDGPLRAWAPVAGVHGMTFLALALSGAALTLARARGRDRAIAGAVIGVIGALTPLLYGREWTAPAGDELRVSIVQGSVPQDRKWLAEQFRPTLQLYYDLTFAEIDRDLVVWPEVAVPALARRVRDYLQQVDERARRDGLQVYLGILTTDPELGQHRNSLIGLGQVRAEYHKRHLVPFGEFFPVPDFARAWMRSAGLPSQDTLPGQANQPPLPVGRYAMSPSICYEDTFGAEQLDFLPAAQLLVNVSNDAWFGDSIAPHQHLQMAQMRALETGRPMIRATNTGVSAIIGPDGRITARSPQFVTQVLRGQVEPRGGATPYIRTGNWAVIVVCTLMVAWGVFVARRESVSGLGVRQRKNGV